MTTEDRQLVITEKTTIGLTIAQALMAVGVLASVVSAGAIAWYAEKSSREAHEANIYVHLAPTFTQEHGLPVGKWDLAGRDEAATRAFKALQDQADASTKRLDHLEATIEARKPRGRF